MAGSLTDYLLLNYDRHALYDRPDWYDFDYIGYKAEAPFYHGVIERGMSEGQVFVELGAGSGRLLQDLLRAKVKCHAVEPNIHMLKACQKMARELSAIEVFSSECAKAHDFLGPPEDPVGFIAFPFNGLLHIHTLAELNEALQHVFQRLPPGGLFACDIMAPAWEVMEVGSVEWGRLDERVSPQTGEPVWTYDRCRFEPATHLMHSELRFIEEGASRGVELYYAQRMWTYQELLGALHHAGFGVEEIYGDVDFAAFDENSPRLLVLAQKPEG
ncbi:MAG: hypothetical protein CMH56_02880 [Myxococcales bacterium]|nr:hypothetical protein [Myxococcales bacterium]|tara:strand:- start:47 stop:862 length:816 start_codon:yes stop_codon:yes gene_type:complete